MAKKKSGAWCYEADCCRQEKVIAETAKLGGHPAACWAAVALRVISALRESRAEATLLALHFIAISAQEMLVERHTNAKLCLLTAMSLAEKALLVRQMATFHAVFTAPKTFEAVMCAELAKMKEHLLPMPDGESTIQLGHGFSMHVMKKSFEITPEDDKPKRKKGKINMKIDPFLIDPSLN